MHTDQPFCVQLNVMNSLTLIAVWHRIKRKSFPSLLRFAHTQSAHCGCTVVLHSGHFCTTFSYYSIIFKLNIIIINFRCKHLFILEKLLLLLDYIRSNVNFLIKIVTKDKQLTNRLLQGRNQYQWKSCLCNNERSFCKYSLAWCVCVCGRQL